MSSGWGARAGSRRTKCLSSARRLSRRVGSSCDKPGTWLATRQSGWFTRNVSPACRSVSGRQRPPGSRSTRQGIAEIQQQLDNSHLGTMTAEAAVAEATAQSDMMRLYIGLPVAIGTDAGVFFWGLWRDLRGLPKAHGRSCRCRAMATWRRRMPLSCSWASASMPSWPQHSAPLAVPPRIPGCPVTCAALRGSAGCYLRRMRSGPRGGRGHQWC